MSSIWVLRSDAWQSIVIDIEKNTVKILKFRHLENCCNHSKIWTMWFYHRVMSKMMLQKDKQCTAPTVFAPTTLHNILKYFKNATLDLCQFLPEGQIISVIDNEMDKFNQLINWLVFDTKIKTFWLKVTVTSRKFKSNPKFKSLRFHKITLWTKKSFVTPMHFQQPK